MNVFLGLNGEVPAREMSSEFHGVGLIRGEYLCRQCAEWMVTPTCQTAIKGYLRLISQMFSGRPVWYRLVDMESSEANMMRGCDVVVREKTTMLGLRGLRRGLNYRQELVSELAMLCDVSRDMTNIHLLLPYVTNAQEVREAVSIARDLGFRNRIGAMAEIPSAILTLPDIIEAGVDQITVGLNDLTSLTLGATRESTLYRRDHPAVLALVRRAVEDARKHNVELSAAGYLRECDLKALSSCGVEAATLHYSDLDKVWPGRYKKIDNTLDFVEIKNSIRTRLNEPNIAT